MSDYPHGLPDPFVITMCAPNGEEATAKIYLRNTIPDDCCVEMSVETELGKQEASDLLRAGAETLLGMLNNGKGGQS